MADNKHYSKNYKGKKPDEKPLEVAVVEGIFKGLWWLITLPFKGLRKDSGVGKIGPADREEFQGYWGQVDFYLAQANQGQQALMEADKILDKAFIRVGLSGTTLGERLMAASSRFEGNFYQQIWQAHKLRNILAHEVGARTSEAEIKSAVLVIKMAVSQLGLL